MTKQKPTYPQLKKIYPDKPEACLRCKLFLDCSKEEHQHLEPLAYALTEGNTTAIIFLVDNMRHMKYGGEEQYWDDIIEPWVKRMETAGVDFAGTDIWIAPLVACYAGEKTPRVQDGTLEKKIIDSCDPFTYPLITAIKDKYESVAFAGIGNDYRGSRYANETIEVPYLQPPPEDDWQEKRQVNYSYRIVNDAQQTVKRIPPHVPLSRIAQDCIKHKTIGLDFEWSPTTGKLHTLAIATPESTWSGAATGQAWSLLKDLVANPNITITGHDLARAEVYKMLEAGIRDFKCNFRCGLIRHWELRNEESKRGKLKDILLYDTDIEKYWGAEEVFNKEQYMKLMETPSKLVTEICRGDAFGSLYYDQILDEDFSIKREGEPYSAMDALTARGGEYWDMRMILPTAYMMYKGIGLDMQKVEQYERDLTFALPRMKQECIEIHGCNPALHVEVGQTIAKYTGSTPYNTGVDVLSELRDASHDDKLIDLIDRVLDYRKSEKMYGTFIKQFKNNLDSDGRIRSYLKVGNTVTGRGSSSQPGLEQIPKHMRDIICSTYFGKEGRLWEYDRSQSEYRCVAYLSELQTLLDAYMRNEDLHTFTANFFEIERKYAKNINFAGIFDATVEKLVSMLVKYGKDKTQATERSKQLVKTLAPLKKYQKQIIKEAYDRGYIEMPHGRRSYRLRKQQIVNTPVQSISAYFNKRTVCEFFYPMWEQGLESYVWLEYHDASHLNVHPDEHQAVKEIAANVYTTLPDILDKGINLPFPLDHEDHGYWWKKT